jgi:prevent-host-death family protein
MSSHTVVEAKNRLSQLIELALGGEEVVITRHGQPVVELKPVRKPPRPVSIESLDWLASRRIRRPIGREDAGTLVSKMRDEDDEK